MDINTSSYNPAEDEIVVRFLGELKKVFPSI